jgi:hypothetical protein
LQCGFVYSGSDICFLADVEQAGTMARFTRYNVRQNPPCFTLLTEGVDVDPLLWSLLVHLIPGWRGMWRRVGASCPQRRRQCALRPQFIPVPCHPVSKKFSDEEERDGRGASTSFGAGGYASYDQVSVPCRSDGHGLSPPYHERRGAAQFADIAF